MSQRQKKNIYTDLKLYNTASSPIYAHSHQLHYISEEGFVKNASCIIIFRKCSNINGSSRVIIRLVFVIIYLFLGAIIQVKTERELDVFAKDQQQTKKKLKTQMGRSFLKILKKDCYSFDYKRHKIELDSNLKNENNFRPEKLLLQCVREQYKKYPKSATATVLVLFKILYDNCLT